MRAIRSLAMLIAVAGLAGCGGAYRGATADETPRSILESRNLRDSWQDITTERISLRGQPAVRYRGFSAEYFRLSAAAAPIGLVASAVPAAPAQEVVEVWLRLRADDVAAVARGARARVEAAGGRVVSDNLAGPDSAASSAALELRVPPAAVDGLLTWIADQGDLQSRRILATDVQKQLVDQTLALQNLDLAMARLQALVTTTTDTAALLATEKELARVRGEIEKLRGEQRWLVDRVDFATITLTVERTGGPVEPSTDYFYPGPRLSTLIRIDPGDRARTRLGGGASLQLRRQLTVDLDIFAGPADDAAGDDGRALLATVGTAIYSDMAGGGRRRFLNPYLGLRIGYGYLDGDDAFAAAAELGLELFRHRYLLIESGVRAVAFLRDDSQSAIHCYLGVAVPF
jgi:uncharacterized protein DUF4349